MIERAAIADSLDSAMGYSRSGNGRIGLVGRVEWELIGPDGVTRLAGVTHNLVTQIGDQFFGERATGIASPPALATGMHLGTGTTAPAKTGAGAAIVTYLAASNVAFDAGFPTSALSGAARRIQWKTTWAAGVATANNLAETVLVNQAIATNAAAPAANTIARALITPTVNKAVGDTLAVTWSVDLTGA